MEKMKRFLKSFRTWGLYVAPFLIGYWLFRTDPDGGLSTQSMLQGLVSGLIGVTVAHLTRKVIYDYLKMETVARKAVEHPIGAGLIYLAVSIVFAVLIIVFAPRAHAQDVRTYVPAGAYKYAPLLKAEQDRLWPGHPMPSALGALVEQESCISLKHSRCWNPGARLKTEREEGAGMGQITRAYRKDGSLRFDALEATRALDPSLVDLRWDTVYRRPDLQLRAIVAMNLDCDRRMRRMVPNPQARLEMCDAAYNGGLAGLQQERRACGQRAGCDPQQWFRHVELVCLKSKVAWKGYGKSACGINREHVEMVIVTRRPKYIPLLET
jgi:hypothetical protein